MLLEKVAEAQHHRVAVRVEDPGFELLLGGVLQGWGYQVVADPAAAELLLADDGLPSPAGVSVVRLGGVAGSARLGLPLLLEELWALLERRFHQPQRQHLRAALDLEVGLVARNRYSEVCLDSLSDMGGRLIYSRELARGEGLLLRLAVEGRVLELDCQVIYSFPRGDGGQFELGVLFEGLAAEVRQLLRRFIVQRILQAAQARSGAGAESGLSFFQGG